MKFQRYVNISLAIDKHAPLRKAEVNDYILILDKTFSTSATTSLLPGSDAKLQSILKPIEVLVAEMHQQIHLEDIRLQVYLPKTVSSPVIGASAVPKDFAITFRTVPSIVPVAPDLLLRDLNRVLCTKFNLDSQHHMLKFVMEDGRSLVLQENMKHNTVKQLNTVNVLVVPTIKQEPKPMLQTKSQLENDVEGFLFMQQPDVQYRVSVCITCTYVLFYRNTMLLKSISME